MKGVSSGYIILIHDSRYYAHRWATLFGAGQQFLPTPSTPRLSTGASHSLFPILRTLHLSGRQEVIALENELAVACPLEVLVRSVASQHERYKNNCFTTMRLNGLAGGGGHEIR